MRISNAPINKVLELNMHKVSVPSQVKSSEVRDADQLDMSVKATEMQRVGKYISDMPDVRTGEVNALQSAIKSRNYHVSDDDLADAVLKNALQ